MKAGLPPLLPIAEIQKRLLEIFPEGTPNRGYCTRDIAAKTVFVMIYVGAFEGNDTFIRPNQVTRMSDAQTNRGSGEERDAWTRPTLAREMPDIPGRWYAIESREPLHADT